MQEAIRLDYYGKHGALANNFTETLPTPEADKVKSLLKDPYIFDMLTFTDQYNERDVEIGLIKHVEKFLVEMGAGFAFMGRQYHIEVSSDDYYIDKLMYNTFLHRYLVIEKPINGSPDKNKIRLLQRVTNSLQDLIKSLPYSLIIFL